MKKTKLYQNFILISIFLSLILFLIIGFVAGSIFTMSLVATVVSNINIQEIKIDFNETEFVEIMYEVGEEKGMFEDMQRTMPIKNISQFNNSSPEIKSENKLFHDCCYPSECSQSVDNPPDCDCTYPVACGTLEELLGD